MERKKLVDYINKLLEVDWIDDSSCNWLQVEWVSKINKAWLAVDACMGTYKKAKQSWCQMLIVHHWLIWWGLKSISWRNFKQIKYLIENWINLYWVHLPLDRHSKYWNNIQLAKMLKLKWIKDFWYYHQTSIWFRWKLETPLTCSQIIKVFQKELWSKDEKILEFWKTKNQTIWVVSGWGSDSLQEAIDLWLDCLITWEWPHHTFHQTKEWNINLIYLWHYYSEKIWVITLWEHLKKKFWIEVEFLDEPTWF